MVPFDTVASPLHSRNTLALLPLPERTRLAGINLGEAKTSTPRPGTTSQGLVLVPIAGAIGMTSAMCLAFITTRITHLSQRSLDAPLDFSNLPFPLFWRFWGRVPLQQVLLKKLPFAAT